MILLQVVIFLLTCTIIASFSYKSKRDIAEYISKTTRSSILVMNYRDAIRSIKVLGKNDFSTVSFINEIDDIKFDVRTKNRKDFLRYTIRINVLSGVSIDSSIGQMIFYVNCDYLVLYFFISFLVVVVLMNYLTKLGVRQIVLQLEAVQNKKIALLSKQVAHDIRSPLATLDFVISDFDKDTAEKLDMIHSVARRIHKIADGLLVKSRNEEEKLESIDILNTLESLTQEIKLRYYTYSFNLIAHTTEATSFISEVEFTRLFSNLINNAVEASAENATITISVENKDANVCIAIVDNGKGIPKEVLEQIGQEGFSHSKKDGNGLGVFHAKKTIEKWGGKFFISSIEEEGTTVSIHLPSIQNAKRCVVFLDDDELLRITWEMKAKKQNIEFYSYSNPQDLLSDLTTHPKSAEYYIDSDLPNGEKGEDTAAILASNGIQNIYMATGHDPEQFYKLKFLKGIIGKDFPI